MDQRYLREDRSIFTPILIIVSAILVLTVKLVESLENEWNYFELFIESINNNPTRVYTATRGPFLRFVAQDELVTEEKEEFIRFLSSSKEIPPPSAGIGRDVYYFQIHEKTSKSNTRTWDIQVKIVRETKICEFWISGRLSWIPLHDSALDKRLSEEFRSYLDSLGLKKWGLS